MADLSKLKGKKGRFGDIPTPDTATSKNLEAPEIAPAPQQHEATKQPRQQVARKKTGRTIAFGTRVSQDFITLFNETAFYAGLKKVELLEAMLKEYRENKGYDKKS